MELKKLDKDFAICKIQSYSEVDLNTDFVFLTKTNGGISLVCESSCIPPNAIVVETDYKALKIVKNVDSELTEDIARITNILSQVGIKAFLFTTYSAVYIFLKSVNFEESIDLLKNNDYTI